MSNTNFTPPLPSQNHAPIRCSCQWVWASSQSLSEDWEDLGVPCGFHEWPVSTQNRTTRTQYPYHHIRLHWPACRWSNPGRGTCPRAPDKRVQAPRPPPPDGAKGPVPQLRILRRHAGQYVFSITMYFIHQYEWAKLTSSPPIGFVMLTYWWLIMIRCNYDFMHGIEREMNIRLVLD